MFFKYYIYFILVSSACLSTTQPAYSMFTTKEELEAVADDIDTIVIGGIRQKKKASDIVSGHNCLTLNTDKESNPNFLVNGFSPKLKEEIPILFEVFGQNGKCFGNIKKVIYEHVGLGIDVTQPEAFVALNSLLSSGGIFEYSSFWEHVSYTAIKNEDIILKNEDIILENEIFLNQALRFKTSYTIDCTAEYSQEDRLKASRLKKEIEQLEKHGIDKAMETLILDGTRDLIIQDSQKQNVANKEHYVKEKLYAALVRSQHDNPESLWKDKILLKKQREYLTFVTSMKPINSITKRVEGLDDHMENFFKSAPDKPYVIDLNKDKEFFCENSLLETNPRFYREVLGLENVVASFYRQSSNPVAPMSFTIRGIKN